MSQTDVQQVMEQGPLRKDFVNPYYMEFMGGGLKDPAVVKNVVEAAKTISDVDLQSLLETKEWRGRISAAWYIGLTKRTSFVHIIGELLLKSELVYAGRGYCLALGMIGGPAAEKYLTNYLKEYLPLRGRYYDQTWAIGALTYLKGSTPEEFMEPSLWREEKFSMDPVKGIESFKKLVAHLQSNQMIA